jgi:hypothetical protein
MNRVWFCIPTRFATPRGEPCRGMRGGNLYVRWAVLNHTGRPVVFNANLPG